MDWLHKPLVAAAAVLGLMLSGNCLAADTRPANGDWFRNRGAMRPPGPDDANAPDRGGRDFGQPPPGMGPGGAGSDFPDDQVHDWVVASARAANARAMFHRAENELDRAYRDIQWTFEHSKEYQDAVAAEKQAYSAYIAERQKALQDVVNDPKYKAAIDYRDEMADRIARLRATSRPGELPREMLLAMASQKLQYASDAHAMETAALEKDAALQDARQKMVQASAKVAELRASFDDSLRSNAQIAQARRALEDARVALITSEAYYNAATAAGAIAADYAYYRHRWDFVPQYTGVGWGPYRY